MISPNCGVNMDSTSTTSSYNAIERIAQSEHMRNNVNDSMDGSIESELLEEPSQDPDDEDTFSDDSLRLRLSSDDEADPSQAGPTNEPAAPCISSEQTTSQDKDMGVFPFFPFICLWITILILDLEGLFVFHSFFFSIVSYRRTVYI